MLGLPFYKQDMACASSFHNERGCRWCKMFHGGRRFGGLLRRLPYLAVEIHDKWEKQRITEIKWRYSARKDKPLVSTRGPGDLDLLEWRWDRDVNWCLSAALVVLAGACQSTQAPWALPAIVYRCQAGRLEHNASRSATEVPI